MFHSFFDSQYSFRVHEEIKPTIQNNATTNKAANEQTTQVMFDIDNESLTNKRNESIEFVEYPESSNARSTYIGNELYLCLISSKFDMFEHFMYVFHNLYI